MAYNFKDCNRDQVYLLPPALQEWLPSKDLVWMVLDVVAEMDLAEFYRKYRQDGKGQAAFEPSMMVSLLLYAYSLGIRSSREIEKLCERDIGFKVITANQVPDHCTISRFRKDNGQALDGLFKQVLKLCKEAGLVRVGIVALDGSKVKANAALEANRTYEHIEQEVKKMLDEAEAKDAEEDRQYGQDKRGDELPDELADRTSRRARLAACKKRLEEQAAEAAAEQQSKIEERQAYETETGSKKRGRKPQEPDPTPPAEAKANMTDPDSRIMKTRSGYVQGYNSQAVVTKDQIIIAAEVTNQENDINQLHPMIQKAQENLNEIAPQKELKIAIVLSDAGYASEKNFAAITPDGPEHLIATKKDWKQRKEAAASSPPQGRIPKGLTLRQRMERKLLTKWGKELYKKRGQIVEPVFGQIKDNRGIRHYMRRGLDACSQEWKLICATHNLLKLWRSGKGVAVQMAI
jgi:transposase